MALFTKDSIERVRDAVDMVELVGAKTDLRRVGSRWSGLCPFHDERTASFSVDPESKLYHCFGCGVGGDAIGFVQAVEGLDFPEAVEALAERYNVRVEREDDDPAAERRRRRRERLHGLLDRTARFYAAFLRDSAEAAKAREYLAWRGLSEEVLADFRVGYSPSAWDRVTVAAQRDGVTPEELMAGGLAQRGRGGGLYDRFRGRIMFPLADTRGRVLGFGARAMADGRGPKYLNSSENELYHKGRQLFGIDLARSHAAKAGRIVVVEGYTDVLAMHQAGIRETVAIMGTALTQEQLAELGRAAPQVVLALDADRSGQDAMLRAARAAQDRGVELLAVEMPEGADPAELLAERGIDAMNAILERASGMIEFQVRRVLADADLGTPAGRDRALEEARALIAAVPERTATRDALVREVADRLDLPADYVTAAERPVSPAAASAPTATPVGSSPGTIALAAERAFLTTCLASGEVGREQLEALSAEHFSSDVTRRAREHLVTNFDDPLVGLPEDAPEVAALVTHVAMAAEEQAEATEPGLRMSFLQLEQRRIERELRRAAESADRPRQDELAAARQDVRREMDAVMGQMA
ncbi:MAG TPA: DNA primase [Thermoleophilaceae bacterium]|nr:DNA primase [Thermoleophilaceae bacterium]